MRREPAYTCPACGRVVFTEVPGSCEVCEVCGWQDDALQLASPTSPGGANRESLEEAQLRVQLAGTTSARRRDPLWRPLTPDELAWHREERGGAGSPRPSEADGTCYWRQPFERVFTVSSYYDGPREGVAMLRGQPCYFASRSDDDEDVFDLWPIDGETLALALEDWALWCRWLAAFHAGQTTQETHPALPADRERWERLRARLEGKLPPDRPASSSARGEFRGELRTCTNARVRWRIVEGASR
jgi:hypothetical protein